jgi:ABC transporter with metal-binding/Fe-S-binding domain ATP-binding protein
MKLASLFSGGKDSTFALYKALREGHEVKYLITAFSEKSDSWMFHRPAIEITRLQSQILGIPQKIFTTKGEKEKELKDLFKAIYSVKDEIDGIVTGAIASEYQKTRIENICRKLNLECISPLWQKDPEKLLREEISLGFEIIFTSVSSQGLDENWLGRRINNKVIDELLELNRKFFINISGEGGEFETLVLDCPIFDKRILIKSFEKIWDEKTHSGYIKINEVKLIEKNQIV